jgi:DHA2 family multidrug resistance protein-like MFS transporter
MADAIPADVTAEAAHNARESVAGATATDLSGVDATDLIYAAHGAFTSGINTIGLIGGAIFIVLAILIATRLR